ncbi:hypothetical protein ACROYT_G007767 [Oculina patagonica]
MVPLWIRPEPLSFPSVGQGEHMLWERDCACVEFPRALISVSHAQKRSALGSRIEIEANTPSRFVFEVEGILVDIQAGKQHISLLCAYKPPSVCNVNFTNEMHAFLDVAMSNQTNVFCLGDLNCDILHPSDNGKEGRAWLDICDVYDLENLIKEPTRISRTKESCLDVIATNAPVFALHAGTLELGLSDHKLVYAVLNKKVMKPKVAFTKSRCFKNFDEEAFNNDLERVPFDVAYLFDDVSDICWAFEKMYTNVLDDHAPLRKTKLRGASEQSKFITPEIRSAMRKRNALKRKYYKTRAAVDWEAYRCLRNRVVAMRRKSIIEHFKRLCNLSAGNPRDFWSSLRPFMNSRHRSPNELITLKEEQGVIKDQNQVAQTFNAYFSNITGDLIENKHTAFKEQSHVHVCRFPLSKNGKTTSTFSFKPTNYHTVKAVLDNIKPNKAQGYDLIPPRAVKASSRSIAMPFCKLINTIISRSQVPHTWKHGQITPLHKKDSVLDKKNFRPVTVLPVFGKVFERLIHMQMTEHFEPIFHDSVFAYRKYHGCPPALLTLTEHWKEELDKRNAIAAIAIDLSKAFDCLPHELILEKLKFYGMEDKAVALLYSYLSSRYQRVKLGDTFSDWTGVAAGVPQGSILGPLLFNIFMNDLNFAIERCKFMNYADDTKIHTSDPSPQVVEEDINRDLANTLHWFQQSGMKANPEKYQALVLGNSDYDMNIKCVDKRIPISKEIKLLGVTLDNRLKFDAHIADICRKVGGQVNALNRLKNILPCSLLGPLLFNIFINDLNFVVQGASLRLYVDDTTTYASDTNTAALELSLNQDLQKLSSWFSSNHLSINHNKTQTMLLGKSSDQPVFHLGGSPIDIKDSLKILGVLIDNKLSFKEHISAVLTKVYAKIGALRRLKRLVPADVALLLYKAYILPHMEHCSPHFSAFIGN